MRFRVNSPKVIHETIDHEVVIINLGTGTYYSLEGTGEEIWTMLDSGAATDGVTEALLSRYDADPSDLRAVVETFAEELRAESLIVPDEGDAATSEPTLAAANGSRVAFAPPRLERFTEMQHLIALDPIHEVDEGQGWPHT